ncbi:hypothetical protein [Nocardioides albus]|uniref:AbiEi antitoxin C-terminal domain-containing protein n=1 Tax=Nocardioides albus TaxID=1841 RepID=A0A7W5A7B8_9ACTN|nr:hypothetical protein [Nocardioides albus]MBB3090755.1 hypothetical protein [Nocardioides albus]
MLEAVVLLPNLGAITGWAAYAWVGAKWFAGMGEGRPVTLATYGHKLVARPGLAISAERMPPQERCWVDGLPITNPARSIAFEMRYAADVREAVRWLDLAMASDQVSTAEAAAYVATLNGWTGVGMAREAIGLADENVWSPTEVDLRLLWRIDLGRTALVCNRPVFDLEGRHIGTPDVLDLEAGLVGEYDGKLHLEGKRRAVDIQREGLFRAAGLEYVTMVSRDLQDPSGFLRRTLEARSRAHRTPVADRRWTIDPPRWWTPTHTVEQRRALTAVERNRFLGNRAMGG